MGTIKDRNSKDLTEVIKKRWQEHIEELYKKGFNYTDSHYGVVTHLKPEIPECDVCLGSIATNTASGGDGIPAELKILKDGAVKVLHSTCQQIWKTQQWPQDWKKSVFISIPKKRSAKQCANYLTMALISHSCKAIFEFLQSRLQWYLNQELPNV